MVTNTKPQTNEDEIVDPAEALRVYFNTTESNPETLDSLEEYEKTQAAVAENDKKKREDAESKRLEESVQAFKANALDELPDDFAAVLCAFLELVGNPVSREWTSTKWSHPQAWLVASNPLYWIESSNSIPAMLKQASKKVLRWKKWREA